MITINGGVTIQKGGVPSENILSAISENGIKVGFDPQKTDLPDAPEWFNPVLND
jgi:hypothetical protein